MIVSTVARRVAQAGRAAGRRMAGQIAARGGTILLAGLLVGLPVGGAAPRSASGQARVAAEPHLRLLEATVAMATTSSVTGREAMAVDHVLALLGDLDAQVDALGNVTLVLGTGSPRRLLAVPLDEPGYVVSRIDDGGYLRMTPVGQGYRSTLAHQYLEGNEVTVVTGTGPVPGAVGAPSAHLTSFAREPLSAWPQFAWQDAYIDVGAGGAGEAAALGVRLMDTVTLIKRPTVLRGELVAAPSVQTKAAAVALAEAAHRIAAADTTGTTVLAWTSLGLINGKGLETVVYDHGAFDTAYVFSRDFGWEVEGRAFIPVATAPLGSGVLSAATLAGATQAQHRAMTRYPTTGGPTWGEAAVHVIGLPTEYQDTPVETVSAADVAALADFFSAAASAPGLATRLPRVGAAPAPVLEDRPFPELVETLAGLVARYGVSGSETPVRQQIETLLPAWADPVVDDAGNLSVTFGQGAEHVVFVAHMDETGYRVAEIGDDGALRLEGSAGLPWIWEAQAALVHTASGDVPAIFEPRQGQANSRARISGEPQTVVVGAANAAEVEALGVRVGDTVTMPKAMRRLGWYRAIARAFDDRAGSTALIEAARRIDPATLQQRVTFAWSVLEEVGLGGAKVLAERFPDAAIVHPIDTFVSSDAPLESRRTAYAPLGNGLVIRVVESINFAPADQVARLQRLALTNDIPAQLGMTSGGTDGQPWVARGVPSLPLSWPGRYSHSPIEVLDLRDLDALVRMIVVLVEQPGVAE
jgi:putative aminopeptidase FrvX